MVSNTGEYTLEIMRKAGWYNKWLFDSVKRYISGDILEIGAGIGNFTKPLSQKGRVTAIDIERKYTASLNKSFKSVQVGYGDIEKGNYFFKDRKFDTIVCLNVLEHVKDDRKALKNMKRLLAEGGRLVLLIPAHHILFSKFDKILGHYRRYSKTELGKILENLRFTICDLRYINWWGAIGWLVFIKILNVQKMPESPVSIFDKLGRILLLPENIIKPPFGLSILVVLKK